MKNKGKKIEFQNRSTNENKNTNRMRQTNIQKKEEKEEEEKEEDTFINRIYNYNYDDIDYYLDISYDIGIYCGNMIIKTIRFIINISGIYLLWILLHYTAAQLYIKFCVPCDIYGFIISPFLVSTPHCQGLRWIIYNGAIMINNMWFVIGTWICSHLLIVTNQAPHPTNE
jgi:hypothetical protein